MVDDPYKVLGISKDATKEEIKKAYRKKAKEYHPDLHPDDPEAARKMNEVNEAYDMLNNPEKYKKKEESYQRQNNPYGNQQWNRNYGGSGGYGQGRSYDDWDPFGGFGSFEDFFGFRDTDDKVESPHVEPGDDNDIRQAVDFINMKQYKYADDTLNAIPGAGRNARWYYLSALANYEMDNQILAVEQIQKAIRKDPTNGVYQRTLQSFQQRSREYDQRSSDFQSYADSLNRTCTTFCLAQFFCMFCCH